MRAGGTGQAASKAAAGSSGGRVSIAGHKANFGRVGKRKPGQCGAVPVRPPLARAVRLALAYWAGVFALGFMLGAARSLWLAPRVGELAAVAIELPVMIAASWWWARRLVAGRGLTGSEAAASGALAFALLLASEAALAAAFGRAVRDWLAALATPPGALGLAGQAAFAAMPWWARKAPPR